MSIIRDIKLAQEGHKKIEWAKQHMPLLAEIEKDFVKNQYFKALRLVVSVHLEAKTACLSKLLAAGGAKVAVTGCNPLSTQDDVAAALCEDGLDVFSWHGATDSEYTEHLKAALLTEPDIYIDDGGDLTALLHGELKFLSGKIIGGSEETTTGVIRLRARERDTGLLYPVVAVNDAYCKYLFDNRYGTGQSVWDGITRTTNLIIAGKTVVVAGYGWCGKGVAMRAKGLGAKVVVTEIDPIKAIEAVMDGFSVMPMSQVACIGDLFITVTGCEDVITKEHFKSMKHGAVMCNAGHFDVEINLPDLESLADSKYTARNNITGYNIASDSKTFSKTLFVLAEGRLVNLAAGDGHPAEIMDMSFAVQALTMKYIALNKGRLEKRVYDVPAEIDSYVSTLKLRTLGVSIDELTEKQKEYLQLAGG